MAVPDIFDEVQEDLRAERARGLMKRFGGLFVVALLIVLAGVAAWQAWQQYKARAAQHEAGLYLAAQALADGPKADRAQALPQLAAIVGQAGPGYRTLARLREASLKADAGDAEGSATIWNDVSNDSQADPLLRDLASLQWALHQIDAGDPGAISARLQPLSLPNNAWHALAQEAQALLALRQGQNDVARPLLKTLSSDTTAPDGVRARAGGLLQRIGG